MPKLGQSSSRGLTSRKRKLANVLADTPRSINIDPPIFGRTTWNLDTDGDLVLSNNSVYTVTPNENFAVEVDMWGAGGAGGKSVQPFPLQESTSFTAQVELIAGGGGGGGGGSLWEYYAGGGGAGGRIYESGFTLNTGINYSISVGLGGDGAPANVANDQTTNAFGESGEDTTAFGLTAIGGGGGTHRNGLSGGSGGGAGGSFFNGTGGAPTTGQGFKGGDGYRSSAAGEYGGGGGGGGAGGPGANFSGAGSAAGGIGVTSPIDGILRAAGGAAGGSRTSAGDNTGSGGSGGNHTRESGYTATAGGNGGSGIIIIKYPSSLPDPATTGLVTSFSNSGGFKTLKILSGSGTLSFGTVAAYSVYATQISVDENNSIEFTVSTANVANGTTLYWAVDGLSPSDFVSTSGSVTINNNIATFTVSLVDDNTREFNEQFRVSLQDSLVDPINILAYSPYIIVKDVAKGGGGGALNALLYLQKDVPLLFTVGEKGVINSSVSSLGGGGISGGGSASTAGGAGGGASSIYQSSTALLIAGGGGGGGGSSGWGGGPGGAGGDSTSSQNGYSGDAPAGETGGGGGTTGGGAGGGDYTGGVYNGAAGTPTQGGNGGWGGQNSSRTSAGGGGGGGGYVGGSGGGSSTSDLVSQGEQEYIEAGTYSWTVPANVTSISAVVVGGGGGGGSGSVPRAGGGGALAYQNNIAVTPGETLTITVGAGGTGGASGYTVQTDGATGGFSAVNRGGTSLVRANGGAPQTGGAVVVGLGGAGGAGGGLVCAGGGGAGGYTGKGGDGSTGYTSGGYDGGDGAGGGAGGGATGNYYAQSDVDLKGGGGGGVGIYGQGESGQGGAARPVPSYGNGGQGGSGGENGGGTSSNFGGAYGGGGAVGNYVRNINFSTNGEPGGVGAVRIIWPGDLRQFPSTRAGIEVAVDTGTFTYGGGGGSGGTSYANPNNTLSVTYTPGNNHVPGNASEVARGDRGQGGSTGSSGTDGLIIVSTQNVTTSTVSWGTGSGKILQVETPVGQNPVVSASVIAYSSNQFPVRYEITSGSLPPGVSLDTETGAISGTRTFAIASERESTVYNFTIRAYTRNLTNNNGASRSFNIVLRGPLQVPLAPGVTRFDLLSGLSLQVYFNRASDDGGTPYLEFEAQTNPVLTASVGAGSTSIIIPNAVKGTVYQVRVRARNAIGWSDYSPYFTFTITALTEYDDISFTTPGTYYFTVPMFANSISMVAIGGGGSGWTSSSGGSGGAGGTLVWYNNLGSYAGEVLEITVGAGGGGNGVDGGLSKVVRYLYNSTVLLASGGGAATREVGGSANIHGSSGQGIYLGGQGGDLTASDRASGGGGAGGYSGVGGRGGGLQGASTAGTGGAGGGGGDGGSSDYGGGGGGVGIWGQGVDGAAGATGVNNGSPGGGGSFAPTAAAAGSPGAFGGGGAGNDAGSTTNARGGGGAVRILWGSGRSFPSTQVGEVIYDAVPSAPIITSATVINGTTVDLTYTNPRDIGNGPITGFFWEGRSSTGGTTINQWNSTATTGGTYRFTGLTQGYTYNFYVKAVNSIGQSPFSAASAAVIPSQPPATPTNLRMTSFTRTSITIAWDVPTDNGGQAITGYDINSDTIGTTSVGAVSSYTFSGLTTGTYVRFRILAKNPRGSSAYSGYTQNYPIGAVPGTPTGVESFGSNGTHWAKFSAPADNGGFAISTFTATISGVSPLYNPKTKTLNSSTGGMLSWTSLDLGNTYTVTVSCTNAVGTSATASASYAMTAWGDQTYGTGSYTFVPPNGVSRVSAVAIGGGGAGSWTGNGGGGGGLAYRNNYAVSAGSNYTVSVGGGGGNGDSRGDGLTAGGQTYFVSTGVVRAGGGGHGVLNALGGGSGGVVGAGAGGAGGRGGASLDGPSGSTEAGGGGAGGYAGNGGQGQGQTYGLTIGSGGGGAGGNYGQNGGGTGLLGRGLSGLSGGAGGSGGGYGVGGNSWGGGGGGGLRVIWPGNIRSFPNLYAGTFSQGAVPGAPSTVRAYGQSSSTNVQIRIWPPYSMGGAPISNYVATVLESGATYSAAFPTAGEEYRDITIPLPANVNSNVDVRAYNFFGASSATRVSGILAQDTGGVQFTSAGTYTWICPSGVSAVQVVCVGGGGGGSWTGNGGGGGALAWKNNHSVLSYTSYTINVGGGGGNGDSAGDGLTAGGRSEFVGSGAIAGGGGHGALNTLGGGAGGTLISGSGGSGGRGGSSLNGPSGGTAAGGGGAGGYSGNGGQGQGTQYNWAPGGGGAGAGGNYQGSGGSVGLLGQGTSGTSAGQAGSGGGYGAGGASWGGGGGGAVRIIWGPGRSFPNTNTGDLN